MIEDRPCGRVSGAEPDSNAVLRNRAGNAEAAWHLHARSIHNSILPLSAVTQRERQCSMNEHPLPSKPVARVAICVITFRRPDGLRRLLEGLARLTFSQPEPVIEIVVVDNDRDGSASDVFEEARSQLKWELGYHIEPRRGISCARNKAISCIRSEVEYIAFIDDDEVPDANWLDELLSVLTRFTADVATGPALPYFVEEPPAWAVKGGFYATNRHPTGTRVGRAFTHNVLYRAHILDGLDPIFNERLGLTGGEDSYLSVRLHHVGRRIVWADDALVREWVPPSRVSVRWILKRGFRIGTTIASIQSGLRPFPVTLCRLLAFGFYGMLKGLALLLVCGLFGRHLAISYLRNICYAGGVIAGLLRLRVEGYRETDRV